jgi:hypothetical protein
MFYYPKTKTPASMTEAEVHSAVPLCLKALSPSDLLSVSFLDLLFSSIHFPLFLPVYYVL